MFPSGKSGTSMAARRSPAEDRAEQMSPLISSSRRSCSSQLSPIVGPKAYDARFFSLLIHGYLSHRMITSGLADQLWRRGNPGHRAREQVEEESRWVPRECGRVMG